MPRPPKNWPQGMEPARMSEDLAAFYLGVSVGTFRDRVKAKKYPQPVADGARKMWITSQLRRFAEGGGLDAPATGDQPRSPEDLLGAFDEDDSARARH